MGINGMDLFLLNICPQPLFTANFSTGDQHISIYKTESSTLPPILNAFEVYKVIEEGMFFLTHSFQCQCCPNYVMQDFDYTTLYFLYARETSDRHLGHQVIVCYNKKLARRSICPKEYLWEGLNCSYNDSNTPRIISL